MTLYDAIIAGGGPAGSSTASYMRMRGLNPLVVEKERFPRFHLGESMLPFSNDIYKELGVFEEIDARYIHKPGARWIAEDNGASLTYYFDRAIDPGRPYAYQVPRAEFDQLLLDNSRRLGAEVREETEVRAVRVLPDRVEVDCRTTDGRTHTECARMFVDATGRDTLMARLNPDLKTVDELITTNVACFTHWRDCKRQEGADEGNFTGILFDGGWWWIIPFKGDVTSVGVVFQKEYTLKRKGLTPQQLYEGAIAEQRAIKEILDGAERIRPIDTTGNWSYRCKRYYGDRFLLAGDAAAFIDPLFSTGALMAMMCGKYAAESIDEAIQANDYRADRFAAYQEKAISGADLFKRLVHEFYTEDLRRLLVAREQNDTVRAVITSMLAGDVYRPRMWHQMLRQGFSRLTDDRRGGSRIKPYDESGNV
mgnify:CR=1 FL=1